MRGSSIGRRMCLTGISVAMYLLAASAANADNWPRFRGADGSGIARCANGKLPDDWTEADFDWKIPLPGVGHSSPIIWGNRLFLTTALDEGTLRYLLCFDAETGNEVWRQPAAFAKSGKHQKSSWASATPATDGQYVYVPFSDEAKFVISAYDFAGERIWERDLGAYDSRHAQGASPIVFEDLVIVPNDQDGPSSVVALDRANGEIRWRTDRRSGHTSYATPLLIQSAGKSPQLICSSYAMGVTSLDPRTGKQNWATEKLPARTVSSPVFAEGLVYQQCGGGGVGTLFVAVDPFARDAEAADRPRLVYSRDKNLPSVPTVLANGKYLFMLTDKGIVHCVEATTGNDIWTKRIGGNYSSSPICVDDKLYLLSEAGEVLVISAGPEFKQFAKVALGDPSHATPAFSGERLYLRTFHGLACLRAK